jgi:two-component system phosphate regulon sensor histidine kinase PhoR
MNKSRKPASIPRHFKHGETQYHNRILAVTNEAAARLLRSADLQEELPEILQILGSALGLTACAIVKTIASDHFGDGADIFLEWQNPSTPKIDLLKLTGFLLSEKKLTSQDLFLNSNAFPENLTSFPPLSIAFIPLFEADHTWGFIGLLTPETHPGWIPAQREAIQTIANIIGAALQRQSSAEHSRAILTALPDLIICMDQFGNILEYSARKNHPLYLPREKANGKKLSEIWNEEIAWQIIGTPDSKFVVSGYLRKEFKIPGSDNIYEARIDPISATETLIVIRDISDQAQLNQMKSDFINRASHELRTPLTTAILMCELIQSDSDPAEKTEYWQILNNELNRQKNLIDRLLMAGRLESDKLTLVSEPLDLASILDESVLAVKSIAKKKNITIEISGHPAPLMVLGDKSGLQQIFINLINNAIKFSPAGSLVNVDVSKEVGKIRISIADQGLGIPPEDMPNLFERFFRARNVTLAEIPGSGVGLYIVKSIIEDLKGQIKVKSEINKGTTFIITLNAMEEGD